MKTVNESVKYLEKYFTSEKITLIDSDGKEFDTGVSYCKDEKGFFKYIKNNFVIYLFILTVSPSNLWKWPLTLIKAERIWESILRRIDSASIWLKNAIESIL